VEREVGREGEREGGREGWKEEEPVLLPRSALTILGSHEECGYESVVTSSECNRVVFQGKEGGREGGKEGGREGGTFLPNNSLSLRGRLSVGKTLAFLVVLT
jgi:hypothetical protein